MKKILVVLVVFLFFIIKLPKTSAEVKDLELCRGSSAAILFETNTNSVLYSKEIDKRLPPASMTKIMTLLLIYEALEKKEIAKDSIITIGSEPPKVEGSKAFLSVGEKISVDDLLKCICIASANDAAIALAIELCGSEVQFVNKMNEKVKALDLKNTHFSDCTGLASNDHYTSAYDLAVISDHLLDKYPDVLNYTNIQQDYIRKDAATPFWLVNTNKMIGRVKDLDGLKTGYTSFSKYCITLHMSSEKMSLISVVFGYEKATTRNAESLELLRYGFANYRIEKLASKGTVIKTINHILYKDPIEVVIEDDLYYLHKKSEKPDFKTKYSYELYSSGLNGTYEIYLNDELIDSTKLSTASKVKKRNLWELMLAVLKECFV